MTRAPVTASRLGEVVGGKYRIVRLLAAGGMGVGLRGAAHGREAPLRGEVPAPRSRRAARHPDPLSARGRGGGRARERERRRGGRLRHRRRRRALHRHGVPGRREPGRAARARGAAARRARRRPGGAGLPRDRGGARGRASSTAISSRENLFVCRRQDGTDLVKVLDFGVAKLRGARRQHAATRTGAVLGTASYMSPGAGARRQADRSPGRRLRARRHPLRAALGTEPAPRRVPQRHPAPHRHPAGGAPRDGRARACQRRWWTRRGARWPTIQRRDSHRRPSWRTPWPRSPIARSGRHRPAQARDESGSMERPARSPVPSATRGAASRDGRPLAAVAVVAALSVTAVAFRARHRAGAVAAAGGRDRFVRRRRGPPSFGGRPRPLGAGRRRRGSTGRARGARAPARPNLPPPRRPPPGRTGHPGLRPGARTDTGSGTSTIRRDKPTHAPVTFDQQNPYD